MIYEIMTGLGLMAFPLIDLSLFYLILSEQLSLSFFHRYYLSNFGTFTEITISNNLALVDLTILVPLEGQQNL